MEKELKVTIRPQHFQQSAGFHAEWRYPTDDPKKERVNVPCPLGLALRDQYPEFQFSLSHTAVSIYKDNEYKCAYRISEDWGFFAETGCKYPRKSIDELCNKAKESLDDIPTVELVLTLCED